MVGSHRVAIVLLAKIMLTIFSPPNKLYNGLDANDGVFYFLKTPLRRSYAHDNTY